MKLNLPNKITLIRICTIPVFMFFIIFPVIETEWLWRIIATVLFAAIALTDMLDGKIARKRGLVTDFGKFLDPLADKMLIFGALLALVMRCALDAWVWDLQNLTLQDLLKGDTVQEAKIFVYVLTVAAFIVIFREMAVTSLRLLASNSTGVVIAAAWAGKVKTTTQILAVCMVLLEGAFCDIFEVNTHFIGSYVAVAAMVVMTLYSGWGYFKAYWPMLKESA